MKPLLPLVFLLVAAPAAATVVAWTASDGPDGSDIRHGSFAIGDAECGYQSMADPLVMGRIFKHLERVDVHKDTGTFQDVTLIERFFLVGLSESRYDRTLDGRKRLEWTLTSGRQARHDGYWEVQAQPDGTAIVTFENLIKAKLRLHQPLLRRIQDKTMDEITEAIRARCR